MAEMTEYPPGSFCWVDLATTDVEGAKSFYTKLFGWEAVDVPAGEEGIYTMFAKDGKDVCAVFALDEEMRKQGVSPFWQSYVSVSNVDESSDRVKQLGGNVIMQPFDVMEYGRMAVIQDPIGASLSLWQPKENTGARLVFAANPNIQPSTQDLIRWRAPL